MSRALGEGVAEVGLDVGFLCQGWSPDAGGVETHTAALARGLVARGHRVHALALDGAPGLEPYAVRTRALEGVDVRRMAYRHHDHRGLADLVRNPRAEQVLLDWLGETPCDVVHVHHLSGFGAGALRAIADLGRPLVLTLHDHWLACPRGQLVRSDGALSEGPEPEACGACLARTWPHLMPSGSGAREGPHGEPLASDAEAAEARTRFALAQLALPQRVLAPSRAPLDVLARSGVELARARVVEHGLDAEALAARVRPLRVERAPGAPLRLGVLGAIQPSKGARELIEAFRAADAPGLELHLHGPLGPYHGDGAYADAVAALARSDPRVHLHGPYAPLELPRVLAQLDGVAAPARWPEVYGLAVREARAAGLPVLVSDLGGLPAAAQEGRAGLVVPAFDTAAWRAALERFAGDAPARARWSAAPHRLRTVAAMVADHERAYAEAIAAVTGTLPPLAHPIEGLTAAPDAAQPARRGLLARLLRRRG